MDNNSKVLEDLIIEIHHCRSCEAELPCGVNPVFTIHQRSRILIIGQAPGLRVHKSGIPWDDQSGKELREWLGVTEKEFYNPDNFGILPIGFCYPGKGSKGDLPPRHECAPKWHSKLIEHLQDVKLTLLIGQFAQRYYLKSSKGLNLTESVRNYERYLPEYFPLPHPSPRNFIWMMRNTWFKQDVLPELQNRVRQILSV